MRLAFSIFLFSALFTCSLASAQEATPTEPEQDQASIRIDPETGERYRNVRPEEPLQRGPLSVDPWVVYVVGGCVVVMAGAFLARRLRGRQ